VNREQLFHAIRAACAITGRDQVIVIGSQSILGSFDADDLPDEAVESREVDVWPDTGDPEETARLATVLEGVAGELSPFEDLHDFYIDGVDSSTPVLPAGWRDRLVPVRGPGTTSVVTGQVCTGWCLEPHDLSVAKLIAFREKDRRFVSALVRAGLVEPATILARLATVPVDHTARASHAAAWLAALTE
jgi:hypothetical protein